MKKLTEEQIADFQSAFYAKHDMRIDPTDPLFPLFYEVFEGNYRNNRKRHLIFHTAEAAAAYEIERRKTVIVKYVLTAISCLSITLVIALKYL